jgi:hypothetical protein
MGTIWTLLPCGFGLHNYIKSHSKYLGFIASLCWLVLLAVHPLLIYLLWFDAVTYWWLFLLAAAHALFLLLFGRNLGTN